MILQKGSERFLWVFMRMRSALRLTGRGERVSVRNLRIMVNDPFSVMHEDEETGWLYVVVQNSMYPVGTYLLSFDQR